MTKQNGNSDSSHWTADDPVDDDFDPEEYDLTLQLERLETLEEDMIDLGVENLHDVRKKIEELHERLGTHD